MARTRRAQTISLTPELGAKLTAAEHVLDVPKSRIHRRALVAYFAALPADQRTEIEARAALSTGTS